MDPSLEAELIGSLERFCAGFANRDPEAVMGLELDPDLVVVTSEESPLRGVVEFRRFLDDYVEGGTTCSWEWNSHDVSTAGSVAWLLAVSTMIVDADGRQSQHPYRMTMLVEHRDDRWVLRQIPGSSPH